MPLQYTPFTYVILHLAENHSFPNLKKIDPFHLRHKASMLEAIQVRTDELTNQLESHSGATNVRMMHHVHASLRVQRFSVKPAAHERN